MSRLSTQSSALGPREQRGDRKWFVVVIVICSFVVVAVTAITA